MYNYGMFIGGGIMRIKRNYMIFGLFLWIAAWIGNVYYFKVLKEPFFLKHYYEVREGMQTISLYYIDMANREDKITSIYFPEIDYKPVILNKTISIHSGNYDLKSIELNLLQGDDKEILDKIKNTLVTKIEVEYKNGEKRVIDIGRIYIYTENKINSDILSFRSISSISGGRTIATFRANDNLKIKKLNYEFMDMDGLLGLKVNGKVVNGDEPSTIIAKDEELTVEANFEFNKESSMKYNVYNFFVNVEFETLDGKMGVNSFAVNNQFIGKDIFNALKYSKSGVNK